MNIDILNQILTHQNRQYQKFWDEIIEPNQKEINQITDYKERQQLQEAHNKLVLFINQQSDLIDELIKKLATAPDKREVQYLQKYIKHARAYIKNLGGNPSVLNYIKDQDIC